MVDFKAFYLWLAGAVMSGRLVVTTRKDILMLPCGCTREADGPCFRLYETRDGWFHNHHGCKTRVVLHPVSSHLRLREPVEVKGNYPKTTPLFLKQA